MRENDASHAINQVPSGLSFPGSWATRSPSVGNELSVRLAPLSHRIPAVLRGSRERAPGTQAVISHCPPRLPLLDPQTILWITRRKIHHFLAGNCGAPQCREQSPATELCFLFAPPKTASSDYSPFKQTMWLLTKSQHLGNANPASDLDLTFPTQMSQNHLRAGRGRKWMVQASSPLIFACLGWQSCMRYASSPNAMLALFKAQQFPRLPVLPLGEPSSPPGSCCL